MRVIEHHIQRKIISSLQHADNLRFSELKPKNLESNVFIYHLKLLIKNGLVAKDNTKYQLTTKGKNYVDNLDNDNNRPRVQPKVIAIIALKSKNNKWLLAKRKIQPYINSLMFPSGMQHWGETSSQHAIRELNEKTGLKSVNLKMIGTADIQISDDQNNIITHAIANVYAGELSDQILPKETDQYQYFWHNFEKSSVKYMPGTIELYSIINKGGFPFSAELSL